MSIYYVIGKLITALTNCACWNMQKQHDICQYAIKCSIHNHGWKQVVIYMYIGTHLVSTLNYFPLYHAISSIFTSGVSKFVHLTTW